MDNKIKIAVIARPSEKKTIIERLDSFNIVEIVDPLTMSSQVDLIFVSQAGYPSKVNAIRALKRNSGCKVIGIASELDSKNFYDKINATAVDEIVKPPDLFGRNIIPIIKSVVATRGSGTGSNATLGIQGTLGRVIAIAGASSVGKTTMSINLALALSKMKYKVLLIGCDLQSNDTDVYLDVNLKRKSRSIYNLVMSNEIHSFTDAVPAMMKYKNIDVILAPSGYSDADQIEPKMLMDLIRACKSEMDFIIVDTSSHIDDISDAIFAVADEILVLSTQTIARSYSARKIISFISECNVNAHPILFLQDSDLVSIIEKTEVEKIVGLKVTKIIPFDRKRIIESQNEGIPLIVSDKRCAYSGAIRDIASLLSTRAQNADYEYEEKCDSEQQGKENAETATGIKGFLGLLKTTNGKTHEQKKKSNKITKRNKHSDVIENTGKKGR